MIQPTTLLNPITSPLAPAPTGTGGVPPFDLSLAVPQFAALPMVQSLAAPGNPLPPILATVGTSTAVAIVGPAPAPANVASSALGDHQPADTFLDQPGAEWLSSTDLASLPTAVLPKPDVRADASQPVRPFTSATTSRARPTVAAAVQPLQSTIPGDATADVFDSILPDAATEPPSEEPRPVTTATAPAPALSLQAPINRIPPDYPGTSAAPTDTSPQLAVGAGEQTSTRPATWTPTPPSLPVMADEPKVVRPPLAGDERDRSASERETVADLSTTSGTMPTAIAMPATTPAVPADPSLAQPVSMSAPNEPVPASSSPIQVAAQAIPADRPTRAKAAVEQAISRVLQPDEWAPAPPSPMHRSTIDPTSERLPTREGTTASETPTDGGDPALRQQASMTEGTPRPPVDASTPLPAAPTRQADGIGARATDAPVTAASATSGATPAPASGSVEAPPTSTALSDTTARRSATPHGQTAIATPDVAAGIAPASMPPLAASTAPRAPRATGPELLVAGPAAIAAASRVVSGEAIAPVAAAPPAAAVVSASPMVEAVTRPAETVVDAPARDRSAPAAAVVAPSASSVPQFVAGTTAPAFRLFAAAIHAARTDESDRAAPPAQTPVAAIEQPRAALPVASAQGSSLDMADHRWPHAMVEHIERLQEQASATRDAASTTIRLVPDALGTIDVAVRRDGETVHVHMAAEQAATRALIADAQPRLQELADARGIRLAQSGVGTGAEGQAQRQPAQQSIRVAAAPSGVTRDDEPDFATTTRIG